MEAKLLDACAVLLGPQARRAGQALLRQLTVATVRAAFRRLALRTHPDSAHGSTDGAQFIQASRAYELLMAFLLSRRPPRRRADRARTRVPSGFTHAGARPHGAGPAPRKAAPTRPAPARTRRIRVLMTPAPHRAGVHADRGKRSIALTAPFPAGAFGWRSFSTIPGPSPGSRSSARSCGSEAAGRSSGRLRGSSSSSPRAT